MQQYQPLKYATIGLRLLIGIATAIIGTYAIKTLFPEISGVIATLIVAAALCVIEPTKDYLTSCIYYEVFTINANRYAWIAILCALLISVIAASCYLNVLGVTHYQNTTTRHVAINADTMARHDAAAINAKIAQLNAQKNGIYLIIDGTQRIRAIKEFLANEFRLEGMEILTELNGKLYSELDAYIQATIDDTEMDFECITPSTDRKIVTYLISKLH